MFWLFEPLCSDSGRTWLLWAQRRDESWGRGYKALEAHSATLTLKPPTLFNLQHFLLFYCRYIKWCIGQTAALPLMCLVEAKHSGGMTWDWQVAVVIPEIKWNIFFPCKKQRVEIWFPKAGVRTDREKNHTDHQREMFRRPDGWEPIFSTLTNCSQSFCQITFFGEKNYFMVCTICAVMWKEQSYTMIKWNDQRLSSGFFFVHTCFQLNISKVVWLEHQQRQT